MPSPKSWTSGLFRMVFIKIESHWKMAGISFSIKKDCGPSSPIRKDGPQHFVTDITQYVNAGRIP